MRHKKIDYLALAGVLASFAMLFLFIYWYFLDGTYVRKLNDLPQNRMITRQTTQASYHPGDSVFVTINVCTYKHGAKSPTVEWQLQDNVITFYTEREQPLMGKGCNANKIVKVEDLPKNLLPDVYHFVGYLKFKVNPIKVITYKLQTNNFEVK